MARKEKRLSDNSISRTIQAFSDAGTVIAPPPGVVLRSDEERVLWDQFTRARAKADWRDMDLILLGKVVRLESELRKLQDVLDREGYRKENARGTEVENALIRVIDTLLRQQLSVIRSMSLNQTATDARSVSRQAKSEGDARRVMEDAGGLEGLIARPSN